MREEAPRCNAEPEARKKNEVEQRSAESHLKTESYGLDQEPQE
jgi:hypothetical protein